MQIGNQVSMATDRIFSGREKTRETGAASFKETLERAGSSGIRERMDGTKKAPYSYLADDGGVINYNGVTFLCDYERNRICLGDVSDSKKCITVALSDGGSLVVNRDNLGDLAKAIGMFSSEDVRRIMRAISQDAMCRKKLQEIDETENNAAQA